MPATSDHDRRTHRGDAARQVTRGRIPVHERGSGPLARLDQRARSVRAARDFRDELMKRSRGPLDNVLIEALALTYCRLIEANTADELSKLTAALVAGLASLGYDNKGVAL